MNEDENSRLNEISLTAQYSEGMNGRMIKHSADIFSRWIKQGSILEMGPADGLSTAHLVHLTNDYEVVEGSSEFCAVLTKKFPNVTVRNSLFENFSPGRQYTNIILGHVLEHVENPVDVVRNCIDWIEPGGRIIAATPNSNSLHRQVAVLAGIISKVDELTQTDLSIGHRRVLNLMQLCQYFEDDRLTITESGGYYLKAFSNSQIETIADEKIRNALMTLGERYVEIAADIYVVATKN
jgi:SAM-dependent methyltransferase